MDKTSEIRLTFLFSFAIPEEERKSTSSSEEDKNRSTESLPHKTPAVTNIPTGNSGDKSASQPNIAMTNIPPKVGSLPLPNRSSYPLSGSTSSASSEMTSSLYSSPSTGSSPSLTSKEGIETSTPESTSHVVDSYFLDDDRLDKSPEDLGLGDLEHDINSALEEIMSGVKSLELQQKDDNSGPTAGMPPKFPVGNLKETPDLVLDLPVGDDHKEHPSPKSTHSGSSGKSSSGTSSTDSDSPTLSTAELFANNNQCTMKKGSSMPRGVTSTSVIKSGEVKRSFSTTGTASSRGKYTKNQAQTAVEIDPEETIWETQKPSLIARRTPPPRVASTYTTPRQSPSPQTIVPDRPGMTERLLGTRSHSPSPGPGNQGPSPVPTTIPHPAPRLTPVSARKDLEKPVPPEKPKPPPKSMKPPLMKKPAKSPEVPRKVNRNSNDEETPIGQSTC